MLKTRWEVAGRQFNFRALETIRWRGNGPKQVLLQPRPGLGSGSLIKHRSGTKALSLGKQEQLSLSFHSLPPPFPPSQHPVYAQSSLCSPKGWAFGNHSLEDTFFSALHPLHSSQRKERANSPSERQRKEERVVNASTTMSCHSILLCSDGLR